jgi:hypothetical protein
LKPFLQTISETGPYFYSRPSLGKWLKKGKALEQRLGHTSISASPRPNALRDGGSGRADRHCSMRATLRTDTLEILFAKIWKK